MNVCVRAEPYVSMCNGLSSLYLTFIKFTTLLTAPVFCSLPGSACFAKMNICENTTYMHTFTCIASYTADTVNVVLSAVGRLNQAIDGQTTLRVQNKTLLQHYALCWAQ